MEPTACPLSLFIRLVGDALKPSCVDGAAGTKNDTTALRLFAHELSQLSILPDLPHPRVTSHALPAAPSKVRKHSHGGSKTNTHEYILVTLFAVAVAVAFIWPLRHRFGRGDDNIIGGAVGHGVGAVRAAGNSAVELVASAANAAPRNAFESMPIA